MTSVVQSSRAPINSTFIDVKRSLHLRISVWNFYIYICLYVINGVSKAEEGPTSCLRIENS